MDIDSLKELYLSLGVGGLSFIVIIFILFYFLKNILPILRNMQKEEAVTKEILQNNTRAIDELSKSTENVATALSLLDKSLSIVHSDVKNVLEVAEKNKDSLTIIKERIDKG